MAPARGACGRMADAPDATRSDPDRPTGAAHSTGADPPEPLPADDLLVVGYDAWTEPVLAELVDRGASVTVVTTQDAVAASLRNRGFGVVLTDDVDEACLEAAGVGTVDAVLVATLDDQWNVLAVLTVMNVDPDIDVVTFAGEARDVPKLRAAGADRVISLGEAVGELLVEVALTDRDVESVVDELVDALG